MVNKADAADPLVLARVLRREPRAVVVSARTGSGMTHLVAEIEHGLPRPDVEVRVLVPYVRGDLLARAHAEGQVVAVEHTEDGTRLHARVPADLAAELSGLASG